MITFFLRVIRTATFFVGMPSLFAFLGMAVLQGFDSTKVPSFDVMLVVVAIGIILFSFFYILNYLRQTEELRGSPWRLGDEFRLEVDNHQRLDLRALQEILTNVNWLDCSSDDDNILCVVRRDVPLPEELPQIDGKSFLVDYGMCVFLSKENIVILATRPIKIPFFVLDSSHKKCQRAYSTKVAQILTAKQISS